MTAKGGFSILVPFLYRDLAEAEKQAEKIAKKLGLKTQIVIAMDEHCQTYELVKVKKNE